MVPRVSGQEYSHNGRLGGDSNELWILGNNVAGGVEQVPQPRAEPLAGSTQVGEGVDVS